jgi:hypothetical protein
LILKGLRVNLATLSLLYSLVTHEGEIVDANCHARVIRAERSLVNSQSALK